MPEKSIRVAAQLGIKLLYHYQDFKPDLKLDVDRLADILRHHRIFCSDPANFNDPWDCKPYFDADLMDDPTIQVATAEYFIANHKGPTDHVFEQRLRNDPGFLKILVRQFSEEMVAFVSERWGVYCLNQDPCCTLMWSHYSRNHRGICLEFGSENSKFGGAQSVEYQQEHPAHSVHDPNLYLSMLRTKSDVWAYEQEFRLICPRATTIKAHPLIMTGDFLLIGDHDLKSIIVGCQADGETIAKIKLLVAEHSPWVEVRRAVRAPNKYRILIEG